MIDKYSDKECRLIIEGTRLSGKSTIMYILKQGIHGLTTVEFRAFHAGKTATGRIPDMECIDRVERLAEFMLSCLPHPVVVNRLHLYALAITSSYGRGDGWFNSVEEELLQGGFSVLLLEVDEETYLRRMKIREREERTIGSIDKQIPYFRREQECLRLAFEKSRLPKYSLNTSGFSVEELRSTLPVVLCRFKM